MKAIETTLMSVIFALSGVTAFANNPETTPPEVPPKKERPDLPQDLKPVQSAIIIRPPVYVEPTPYSVPPLRARIVEPAQQPVSSSATANLPAAQGGQLKILFDQRTDSNTMVYKPSGNTVSAMPNKFKNN